MVSRRTLDDPYAQDSPSRQASGTIAPVEVWLRAAPFGGGVMIRVTGVGCLFKIEQFFKRPESTLCGLQKTEAVRHEPKEGQIADRVPNPCQPSADSVCWALRA